MPNWGPGTNTGHGHVWARLDGVRARCGGPAICSECAKDQVAFDRRLTEAIKRVGNVLFPIPPDGAGTVDQPMEHEFIRYVQRMVGRAVWYQALCSCRWLSGINSRPAAWAEWDDHRHQESQVVMAGLKQALTGQEP